MRTLLDRDLSLSPLRLFVHRDSIVDCAYNPSLHWHNSSFVLSHHSHSHRHIACIYLSLTPNVLYYVAPLFPKPAPSPPLPLSPPLRVTSLLLLILVLASSLGRLYCSWFIYILFTRNDVLASLTRCVLLIPLFSRESYASVTQHGPIFSYRTSHAYFCCITYAYNHCLHVAHRTSHIPIYVVHCILPPHIPGASVPPACHGG